MRALSYITVIFDSMPKRLVIALSLLYGTLDSSGKLMLGRMNGITEPYAFIDSMLNIRINPSVTYQVNQKINLALRYNRTIMDPKIATQFYTSLTDFGVELRYTFN